jgi:tRNA(fMet)-specific endonuclease VapC
MAGDILLDTNVVVALLKRDPAIVNRIAMATEVFVTAVTIGELYFGALKSSRQAENLQRIETFVSSIAILNCNEATAKCYGGIKWQLQTKGKPIPENDLWIAAIAHQYDFTLLTRDRHFRGIERVRVELW